MITSALITQCRQEFGDIAKSTQMKRTGDGSSTLFNVVTVPVIESSYSHYVNNVLKTEGADYTFNLDSGDLVLTSAPSTEIRSEFKFANWRDLNWNLAINHTIEQLNGRGFFRQIARNTSLFAVSANVRTYSAPSACIDVYELLAFNDRTISGTFIPFPGNWSYQQDANKILLGWKPSVAQKAAMSYLRRMKTYSATSATLDTLDDWVELIKVGAGAKFYRYMAGKIAKQGNATIDEGHFSFTNLRTQAKDLEDEFAVQSLRMKPTRPAKQLQYHVDGVVS